MATTLDTAIRISAEVKGGGNIDRVKRSLQDLAKGSQVTAREIGALRSAAFQFARANDGTIAGIRNSITAFRGLQEQAKIGSREFTRYGSEIQKLEARLKGLDGTAKAAGRSLTLRDAAASAAGTVAMGGGPMAAIGAAGGTLAAAGGAAGIAAAGTLALTGALTVQAVTSARALEEQSRRLRVMTADGDALQQSIISLTRNQGYLASTTEASAAAYEILQAGFSKNVDILKILEASTYGAAGGFTDIRTVADATTSILNGYGLTAQSAARIVDQMKAVTDDGKISMEAYSQSIGRVVPSAAAARLSLEEINGAIAALTAQGVPVETTFGGINQAIKTILKPTQEAKDLSKAIGLEFNSQALAAKGLGGFLADVAQKTGKSSDALSILFSDIDGYKAVVALLNDDLKRFNQFTENQASALGKASAAAKIGIDPLKQYDNAWKDFSSTLGKVVLPVLTEVTKAATDMLQAVLQGTEQIGTTATYRWLFNGGRAPQRSQGAQGPMGPAVPERLLRQPRKAAANPPNVAAALAAMDGGGGGAESTKATKTAPQSNLNQLLIENLRLNTELGNVGKDRISQLNAEIELIPQILKLQLSVLNASVKGQDLQQSRINAITEARARSADLEQQLEGVNKEVADIAEQATSLRVSTLSGLLPKESPLKEAIKQVKTELLEADKAAEDLLNRISGLAGTNPASGAARAAIGNLRGDLATADPGEIASQRLVQGDVDALRQQVVELQNAGRELSALDQLVLKYGEDWEQIDPKIRASLGALSEQKDKLEELNRVNERNKQLAEGVAGTIGGGLSSAMDLLIDGTEEWGNSLKEIASGVLKDIARQLTQALVIAPIVKGITKGFGFADGGIMSPSGPVPLKTYARGGIANSPQLALYGEGSMNEAYVPLPDGRRIPVALQGGMRSGSNTSVVVNVDASGNSKVSGDGGQAEQLGRVVSQAVQAELIRQKRAGGLLA
jgi:TP901 family phage tail tape measure protein